MLAAQSFGLKGDKYVMKKVIVSLACDTPTGPYLCIFTNIHIFLFPRVFFFFFFFFFSVVASGTLYFYSFFRKCLDWS